MKRFKLIQIRKQKGYTQQQIADMLPTDVSNYSRKESGDVKIVREEWDKIARFLDVSLEDIFEDQEINNLDYETINNDRVNSYIQSLENENMRLKELNANYIYLIKENAELRKVIDIIKNIINK